MARRTETPPGLWERWQFAIVGGFLFVSALAFVLGMWVGRDVAERHPPQPERVAKLDAPERPPAEEIPRPVGREFFDEHREEISDELAEEDDPNQELPVAKSKSTNTKRRATATRRQPVATERRATATRVPPTATRAPATATEVVASGPWFVQVGATTDLNEVLQWAVALRGMGLVSKTQETQGGGTKFLRVRLGPYRTRDEAVAVLTKVQKNPKFKTAYVTSQ